MRLAIKTAEAASPYILWIDEIEKAFAGVGHLLRGGMFDDMFRMDLPNDADRKQILVMNCCVGR